MMNQMPVTSPGTTRRRSFWWIWVIVICLFISMVSGLSHSFDAHPRFGPGAAPQSLSQVTSLYKLGTASQIFLNDLSGSITVQVTEGNSSGITISTDDGSHPDVSYSPDSMTVNSSDNGNIVVSIPQNIALNLNTDGGSIEVDGFAGRLNAQSNSGGITLNNDHLSDSSTLSSGSGDINLQAGSLNGHVTFSTGADGNIIFNGTLNASGSYQFTTDGGDIDLNLPVDTAMQVQSFSGTGNYQSDFSNPTGNGPQAAVTVKTNTGTISIHHH
jgi:DUF4097 and DUF4098 domain-containing protein YvlB